MVSFNHDVSSLTRKDPALKYNLRNRPSSRSAAPAGPAIQTPAPLRRAGERGKPGGGQKPSRGPARPGESPWGLLAPRLLRGDGPGGGKENDRGATPPPPLPRAAPRGETAVAPLASSCLPLQSSFPSKPTSRSGVSPAGSSLLHGGGRVRGRRPGDCGRAPGGCSRAGEVEFGRGGMHKGGGQGVRCARPQRENAPISLK